VLRKNAEIDFWAIHGKTVHGFRCEDPLRSL